MFAAAGGADAVPGEIDGPDAWVPAQRAGVSGEIGEVELVEGAPGGGAAGFVVQPHDKPGCGTPRGGGDGALRSRATGGERRERATRERDRGEREDRADTPRAGVGD